MPPGSFGPRLQGTVGYFTGRLGVSQRDVVEVLDSVFHTAVGLGSVPALEQAVSTALATPVEQAQEYVQQQPVVNADETGWHQGPHRQWVWLATTPLVTVFVVLAQRGAQAAQRLLGETFAGILGSDRWSAYNWVEAQRRQLCWAHLKRDFQALVDRGGESARIGQALLDQVQQLFDLWYRVRDGTLSRAEFQTAMDPLQKQVGELLHEGAALAHTKTRHTCANILKLEVALWTFVTVEGVEPTNNSAERPLRRTVLWRRRSFGTQSEPGSQFVGRVLTTVTTSRQQRRDVLDYLTAACAAAMCGAAAPSLLPNQPTLCLTAATSSTI
jgi:transposase